MFYLAETVSDDYEVIDGQQRLTTIFGFIDQSKIDNQTRKKLFKKIEIKDNNKRIPVEDIKKKVLSSKIFIVEVAKSNLNAKYEIFRILNQGATALKPQEIRNSIFTSQLRELNILTKWLGNKLRKVTGLKLERMAAEELALRFILVNKYGYESDLRNILDDLDKLKRDFDQKAYRASRKACRLFINRLQKLFGPKDINRAFQVLSKKHSSHSNKWSQHFFSGNVNQGLFHLFSYYLPKYNSNQINKINSLRFKKVLLALLKNRPFVNVITGSGTNSKKNIQKSKELFERYFLNKTFGTWAEKEPRTITRNELRTIVTNIPFCYLSYKRLPINEISKIHIDHISPYTDGNNTKLSNLLPALKTYNIRKRSKSLEDFRNSPSSIKARRKNQKNINEYLKCLRDWNKTYPLEKYRMLRRFANLDKRL